MNEESPFISITDAHGRLIGMIAEDVAAWLASNAPKPSQHVLDAMLAQARRVRVLDWEVRDDRVPTPTRVLCEASDADSLQTLRTCLSIVEDPQVFGHCMCTGGPLLEFSTGETHLATISLHHGRSIRWEAWGPDAVLRDGRPLAHWLAERGVGGAEAELAEG